MTSPKVPRAVRRAAAAARNADHRARDGHRRIDSGVTEEVMLRCARHVHAETGMQKPVPGRRRRAQLRRATAAFCARARSRTSGSSRRRAMPAGRWVSRSSSGISCSTSRDPARRVTRSTDRCSARDSLTTEIANIPGRRGRRLSPLSRPMTTLCRVRGRPDRGEKVVGWFQDRMEFGPRALGSRSIIGDARSAADAVGDEPEDQVPRVLPAVRPFGPARNASTNTSTCARGNRARTCYWSRRCSARKRMRIERSGTDPHRHRQAETAAFDDARDHPR